MITVVRTVLTRHVAAQRAGGGKGVRWVWLIERKKTMTTRRRCNPDETPCKPYRAPLYSSAQGTLTIRGRTPEGEVWQNSFGYAAPSTITQSEAADLTDNYVRNVLPLYVPLMNAQTSIDQVTFRNRTQAGDVQSIRDINPPLLGTMSGDGMPSQTTLGVTKFTNHAGGVKNGAVKLPPVSETANNFGRAIAPYLTDVAVMLAAALRQSFGTRLAMVVLGSKTLTVAKVLSLAANAIWDSANTRKAGRN